MTSSSSKPLRLNLAHLVDLEYQLERDEARSRSELNERDGEIGRRIGARDLDDRTMLVRWLEEIGDEDGPRPGQKVQRFVEIIRTTAIVLGLLLGLSTVAGWLSVRSGKPINSIHFWGALVGLQLLFILLWLGAIVPTRWLRHLPLAGEVQALAALPGRIVPAILTAIGTRLSADTREALGFIAGLVQQYNQLYGRIRLWLILQITQGFAVALNIGFIAAFIALALVSDPAFGWRSTLLDAEQVHRAAEIVALPWSWIVEDTVPTLDMVQQTRYSSLADAFTAPAGGGVMKDRSIWAMWWPFLLVSLLVYGLAPRLLMWISCASRYRAAVRGVRLDHASLREVRDRLRRPLIDTRAALPDANGEPARATSPAAPSAALPGEPCAVLVCPGVTADDEMMASLLASALGGEIAWQRRLAGLDEQTDRAVVAEVAGLAPDTAVGLVVEAWELPVGEYLDFIAALRQVAGRDRLLIVLLYHQDPAGRPVAPRADHAGQWQSRLQALGDPYLRTQPLITETSA